MDQETYSESLFSFGLFKLLDLHNQRSSLLFSIDLQAFPMSRHLLASSERLLMRWNNKLKKKKLFYFSLSLYLVSSLSLSFFLSLSLYASLVYQRYVILTIFLRLVICREKTLMGSLGSYACLG